MFFYSCQILKSLYKFDEIPNNELIINIPGDMFDASKEKIIIEIKLNSKSESIIFNFNAYYGINKAYCFLSPFKHTFELYELYFYKPIKVKYKNIELTETDSFENDSRSRMILINPPKNIIFDEITFKIEKFQPNEDSNIDSNNSNDSFEVAIFDISKN